jgi:hypothetical protein
VFPFLCFSWKNSEKKNAMKLLILSKSTQELTRHIISVLDDMKWVVVSSFQVNVPNWENDKCEILTTKRFKELPITNGLNIIFDSYVGTLDDHGNEIISKANNVIIISQKPDVYFPSVLFSFIFMASTKSSKLLHLYNLMFQSEDYTFEMFKADNAKSAFLYLDSSNKVPIKVNDFTIIKNKFSGTPLSSHIKSEKQNDDTRKKCNVESEHCSISIRLKPIGSIPVVKKEMENMCSENVISHMVVSCNFSITEDYLSCNFCILEKRLDLFSILLMNMIRALKQTGKVSEGCIYV